MKEAEIMEGGRRRHEQDQMNEINENRMEQVLHQRNTAGRTDGHVQSRQDEGDPETVPSPAIPPARSGRQHILQCRVSQGMDGVVWLSCSLMRKSDFSGPPDQNDKHAPVGAWQNRI